METKAAATQVANTVSTVIPKNVRVFADSKKIVFVPKDGWFQLELLEEVARKFNSRVWSPSGNPSIRRVYMYSGIYRFDRPDYCKCAWIQENKYDKKEVHFVFTEDFDEKKILKYIETVINDIYEAIDSAKS